MHSDKGSDYRRCRAYLKTKGTLNRIARRGVEGINAWENIPGVSNARMVT